MTTKTLVGENTEELLTELMSSRGLKVININIEPGSTKGDNYLGIIAKITIDCENDKKEKIQEHLIMKSASKNENLRKFAPIKIAFEREIYIYSKVLPRYKQFLNNRNPLKIFKSYAEYLQGSDEYLNEYLLLKDMKAIGYKMQNRKVALDINHVKLVLTELGRFHAISFAFQEQHPEEFQQIVSNMKANYFAEMDLANFEQHATKQCDKARDTLDPNKDQKYIQKFELFRKNYFECIVKVLDENCSPYAVIRHGDCWTNNFLFAYKNEQLPKHPTDLCFLDFQLSHLGSPALDLHYFMYACTDGKLRDAHYTELINHYYSAMNSYCTDLGTNLKDCYPIEMLWQHLKKYGSYGLSIAIMLLHLLLSEADEVPDMEEAFQDTDVDKIMEKFDFKSKNVAEYSARVRDVIYHVVDNNFI